MQRDQIHKNAKLNEGAFNIDQLNTQAQGTTSGKELEARAKLHDAYLQFGQTILPIYTQALIMASNAMQTFTDGCNKTQLWPKHLVLAYWSLLQGWWPLADCSWYFPAYFEYVEPKTHDGNFRCTRQRIKFCI